MGAGEGIVWACTQNNSPRLWFKTKGASHVTPIKPQKRESADHNGHSTLHALVTEQRLEQGIEYLREMGHPLELRSVPVFTQWVAGDVIKEEGDNAVASGLKEGDVRKAVSRMAAVWFKNYLLQNPMSH